MSVDRTRSIGSRNVRMLLVCAVVLLSLAFAMGCEGGDDGAAESPSQVWPSGALVASAVISADRGLVVSAEGQIYRTVDQGRTWRRAHAPAVEGLTDLSMVDDRVGWAAGPGVILRTDNGGDAWTRQGLPGRAADNRIRSLAALDDLRALALTDSGGWIVANSGGATWLARERSYERVASGEPGHSASRVRCFDRSLGKCYAIGDALWMSSGVGEAWEPVPVADAAGLPIFVFRTGGVELDSVDQSALEAAVTSLAGEPVRWRVEARVSRAEIERYAEDQDPSALFALIEARGQEVQGRLEATGVASVAIETGGAPPWGYEDHLDDDPDFLARYWRERRSESPSVIVRAATQQTWTDVAIAVDGVGILAVAEGGQVFAASDRTEPLSAVNSPGQHDVLAVQAAAAGWVAVGRQGGLWLGIPSGRSRADAGDARVDGRELLSPSQPPSRESLPIDWRIPMVHAGAAFFETIRDVAASTDGMTLLAVGDEGRMLWSGDAGATWRLLGPMAPAGSSAAASVPITR